MWSPHWEKLVHSVCNLQAEFQRGKKIKPVNPMFRTLRIGAVINPLSLGNQSGGVATSESNVCGLNAFVGYA
jgi:hypothetical protein